MEETVITVVWTGGRAGGRRRPRTALVGDNSRPPDFMDKENRRVRNVLWLCKPHLLSFDYSRSATKRDGPVRRRRFFFFYDRPAILNPSRERATRSATRASRVKTELNLADDGAWRTRAAPGRQIARAIPDVTIPSLRRPPREMEIFCRGMTCYAHGRTTTRTSTQRCHGTALRRDTLIEQVARMKCIIRVNPTPLPAS